VFGFNLWDYVLLVIASVLASFYTVTHFLVLLKATVLFIVIPYHPYCVGSPLELHIRLDRMQTSGNLQSRWNIGCTSYLSHLFTQGRATHSTFLPNDSGNGLTCENENVFLFMPKEFEILWYTDISQLVYGISLHAVWTIYCY
jgi:hypothetical protein